MKIEPFLIGLTVINSAMLCFSLAQLHPVGAQGVVSVASNVIPHEVAHMVRAYQMGKPGLALRLHEKYYQLFKDLFIETNPGPVKSALAMMGLIQEEFRLPLAPMSLKNRHALKATLKACGVLK